uniref:Uncharacterized protein n=1 Tax=Rhizophora mucronata TaxID=61149 RepID=A0A2P2J5I7_RHIMU
MTDGVTNLVRANHDHPNTVGSEVGSGHQHRIHHFCTNYFHSQTEIQKQK